MILRTSLMRSCGRIISRNAANSIRHLSSLTNSFSINPLLKTCAVGGASWRNEVCRKFDSPVEFGARRSISVTPDTAMKYLEKDKHSHTKDWIWERGTSVALLLCFPAAFVVPLPIVDFTFTTLGVFHGHLGYRDLCCFWSFTGNASYFFPQKIEKVLSKNFNPLERALLFDIWGTRMLLGVFFMIKFWNF